MSSTNEAVYIYELDEVHPSPQELAAYFEVSPDYILDCLDKSTSTHAALCRGFHICWDARRRPSLYKPVRIVEKDLVFPSVRHMSYFYRTDIREIYHALQRPDGFWDGWHIEYVPKTA